MLGVLAGQGRDIWGRGAGPSTDGSTARRIRDLNVGDPRATKRDPWSDFPPLPPGVVVVLIVFHYYSGWSEARLLPSLSDTCTHTAVYVLLVVGNSRPRGCLAVAVTLTFN